MIRLLVAAGVSLAVSLLGTWLLIGALERRHIGQPIREDGPQGHVTKAGTPTMGGVAIVGAATVAWIISDLSGAVYTRRGLLCMAVIFFAGVVGLIDDWTQGVPRAQPGAEQASQDPGTAHRRRRFRRRHVGVHQRQDHDLVHTVRLARHRDRPRRVGHLRRGAHPGHDQRRQPDRRPRWAGRRVVDLRLRGVHRDRVLGIPPHRGLQRRELPRHRRRGRGHARRLRRLPVVERRTGEDLHG